MQGIGIGVSDFKMLRLRDNYFIDKSLIIKTRQCTMYIHDTKRCNRQKLWKYVARYENSCVRYIPTT